MKGLRMVGKAWGKDEGKVRGFQEGLTAEEAGMLAEEAAKAGDFSAVCGHLAAGWEAARRECVGTESEGLLDRRLVEAELVGPGGMTEEERREAEALVGRKVEELAGVEELAWNGMARRLWRRGEGPEAEPKEGYWRSGGRRKKELASMFFENDAPHDPEVAERMMWEASRMAEEAKGRKVLSVRKGGGAHVLYDGLVASREAREPFWLELEGIPVRVQVARLEDARVE